jgi:hypothetical protein
MVSEVMVSEVMTKVVAVNCPMASGVRREESRIIGRDSPVRGERNPTL